jgi:hypothetical protein
VDDIHHLMGAMYMLKDVSLQMKILIVIHGIAPHVLYDKVVLHTEQICITPIHTAQRTY